ncbi:hypothetical protein CBOM_05671 [Ceraceosorus bombacis]|uniref:Uncharacterized protein n=1 Tax=Ceraceosorus bombacis TaxID=401625 RepID=A0A0P1BS34_9BASI|nr:hypothetical protein CBOM_05671 [Ceraceosorus bombacis]
MSYTPSRPLALQLNKGHIVNQGIIEQGNKSREILQKIFQNYPQIDRLRCQGHLQNMSKAMGHVSQRHSAVYDLLEKAQVDAMISALCAVAEAYNLGLPPRDTFNGNDVQYVECLTGWVWSHATKKRAIREAHLSSPSSVTKLSINAKCTELAEMLAMYTLDEDQLDNPDEQQEEADPSLPSSSKRGASDSPLGPQEPFKKVQTLDGGGVKEDPDGPENVDTPRVKGKGKTEQPIHVTTPLQSSPEAECEVDETLLQKAKEAQEGIKEICQGLPEGERLRLEACMKRITDVNDHVYSKYKETFAVVNSYDPDLAMQSMLNVAKLLKIPLPPADSFSSEAEHAKSLSDLLRPSVTMDMLLEKINSLPEEVAKALYPQARSEVEVLRAEDAGEESIMVKYEAEVEVGKGNSPPTAGHEHKGSDGTKALSINSPLAK